MKTFKTVGQAMKFIENKINKGTEFIINYSLHFGVGDDAYAFNEDVEGAGLSPCNVKGIVFTHLVKSECGDLLRYLLDKDGYLAC